MKNKHAIAGTLTVLLSLILTLTTASCGAGHPASSAKQKESQEQSSEEAIRAYEIVETEKISESSELTEISEVSEDSELSEESEVPEAADQESASALILTVETGEYLITILKDIHELGFGDSVDQLLELTEVLPSEAMDYFEAEVREERAFRAEGYIAPGIYEFTLDQSPEEVIGSLLDSWLKEENADKLSALKEEASNIGFTLDEVLVMASIIEYESSFDTVGDARWGVAAVVRNRLDLEMRLEMDVTYFYTVEGLSPYLDPERYGPYYDTYEAEALPAGPIGSPSMESMEAALYPADSAALYFIYDRDGNYYFSEDYETHLGYCERYLD